MLDLFELGLADTSIQVGLVRRQPVLGPLEVRDVYEVEREAKQAGLAGTALHLARREKRIARIHTQPASQLDELLPHRWRRPVQATPCA